MTKKAMEESLTKIVSEFKQKCDQNLVLPMHETEFLARLNIERNAAMEKYHVHAMGSQVEKFQDTLHEELHRMMQHWIKRNEEVSKTNCEALLQVRR